MYVGSAQLRLVKRKQTKVLMTRMCRQNMPTEDGERRRKGIEDEEEERAQGRAEKERERPEVRHCLQIVVVVVVVVVPREWLSQAPADESGGSGSFSFSFGGFCCVRQNRREERGLQKYWNG